MRRPLQRPAVSAVALALLAPLAPLALGAVAPASAAGPDPVDVLSWKISTSFDEVSDEHTLADGATESDAGVISFPRVSGTYDRVTGVAAVTYDGSVTAVAVDSSLLPPLDPVLDPVCQVLPLPLLCRSVRYSVTLADPVVTVDSAGVGRISATVSSSAGSATTEPAVVEVTTFSATGDPWVDADLLGSLTRTPAWDGVLPPDSAQATQLGIPAGQPVMGRSFSPAFLGQLVEAARSDFYATGAENDAAKAPAEFVAVAQGTGVEATPTVAVDEVSTNADTGATYSVTGTGFTPGPSGIVVAIAESGQVRENPPFRFAATEQVVPAQFVDDTFATVISAAPANLDSTKSYSIYTVSATPNNASQDTETPIVIDFEALEENVSVDFSTASALSSAYGRGSTIKLRVTGTDAGVVSMTGLGSSQTAPISSGVATFTVPTTLAVGSYRAKFSFAGNATTDAHEETMTYRVEKARPTINAKFKSIKRLLVKVIGPKTVAAPTGKVVVQFKPTGKNKSGAVKRTGKLNKKGAVTVSIPTLKKGTYVFSVRYVGNASFFGQKASRKITVA